MRILSNSNVVSNARRLIPRMMLLAALVIAALGLLAYRHSPTRGLPYHDSFVGGKAEEWKAFGGTWELVKGSMRNDSDERGAKLLTGSTYWRDYSVEADVMLLGLGGDAGLVVRSSDEEQGVDAYSGYYAGLRTIDNSLVLGRAGHGWMETSVQLSPRHRHVQASQWYHLKLLAYGCQLAAAATLPGTATPMTIAITDQDCVKSGRAGLRSYSSGGVWRNVVVRPATRSDLVGMLAHLEPLQPFSKDPSLTENSTLWEPYRPVSGGGNQTLSVSPNAQAISSLRLTAFTKPVMATVRGIVILTSPVLFVQDSTGGISVQQLTTQSLKVGDEVEVTGQLIAKDFSSILSDAAVRVLWERTPMPAVSVTASQAATGAFDATFIEVEGRLRQKKYGPGDTLIFDLDAGPQSFRAIMNRGRGDYLYGRLKADSLLRLRGVSVADSAYTHDLVPFTLLLRSSDDVEVLAGPPWWSAGHVVAIAIAFLMLALVTNFFYHRVENWRLRAVLAERERLAYEMHDTLAQSFAGIGFQLEAIRNGMHRDGMSWELPKLHQQLDLASGLVRHSHEEARRSIAVLRPQQLGSESLLAALTACAHRLVEGGSVQVVATSLGDARPVSLRIADTLYRIGQEALANAVRHAHPSRLTIRLEYEKNLVRLLVEDDGRGFAQGTNTDSEREGFGISGMRKRATNILATLEIRSAPGAGTGVWITAILPPRLTFRSWPKFTWNYLREHARYAAHTRKLDPRSYSG